MTYEEALQLLGESKKYWARIHPIYKAHDIAIEALEKQIPKKINIIKEVLNAVCCPNCHYCLGNIEVRRRYKTEYKCCPNCGQALDWSNEK